MIERSRVFLKIRDRFLGRRNAFNAQNNFSANDACSVRDYDIFCNCQDFDIHDVQIDLKPATSGMLKADVQFRNFKKPGSVHLTLKKTPQECRLCDAKEANGSLRTNIQHDTKETRELLQQEKENQKNK